MTNPTQLIEQLASLLKRYRTETPLGHQPYLIAETVDGVLADAKAHLEQPAEPAPVISYGMQSIHDAITDDPSLCEPSPSMVGDAPKIGCVQHDCAECQARAALPAGELTQRITDYLAGGGLFNPELANHDAVRDLLIDCREALAAARPQPVLEPLTECRIELVTAIQTLASHYENKCYKFQDDKEVLADAQGDIDRARQVASKWNWNGITQGGKV
jgi:hypothetical protein